jgi:hypothetical protein
MQEHSQQLESSLKLLQRRCNAPYAIPLNAGALVPPDCQVPIHVNNMAGCLDSGALLRPAWRWVSWVQRSNTSNWLGRSRVDPLLDESSADVFYDV